jgi:nicotinamide mononucleotide adenylyltransferase
MKFRKLKSKKKIIIKKVNKNGNVVNIWDVINENFANINLTCKNLKKSKQNLSMDTNMITKNLKSQAITRKRIIDDTVANLKETKNNLKIAKINKTSLKRTKHEVNDKSKKIPGFPHELPN